MFMPFSKLAPRSFEMAWIGGQECAELVERVERVEHVERVERARRALFFWRLRVERAFRACV